MLEREVHPGDRFPLINRFVFLLLLFLLTVPPYIKGLFFHEDQWNYLILAVPVFIMVVIFNPQPANKRFDVFDCLMLAFPLAYLVAAIRPVYFFLAVNETLKYFAWFFIYYMVSRLATDQGRINTIISILYVSGLGVAAACIPMALKAFDFAGGYTGLFTSFFQYKNTLAAFLGAVLFLGLYLWRNHRERSAWLIALANFIIMFGMRGTSSRGGILAFCAALLLFALMYHKRTDYSVYIHMIMLAVITLFSAPLFIGLVNLGHGPWALLVFMVALAVSGVCDHALRLGKVYLAGSGRLAVHIVLALVLVILLMSGTILDASYFTGNMEKQAVDIQTGGGTDPVNIWYRLYYDRDAFEMAAQRPLFGWGGGGWQSSYRYYQDFLYNTKRIHNHFLEVLVESGLVGFGIFIGLWALFVKRVFYSYREGHTGSDEGDIWIYVSLSAITLGLHAAVDFSLTFLSVLVFISALFGIMRSISGVREEGYGLSALVRVGLIIISLLIMPVTAVQLQAQHSFTLAQDHADDNKPGAAKQLFEDALRQNGWNSNYHLVYAKYLSRNGDTEDAFRHAFRAVELNPYLGSAYIDASRYALDKGNITQAVFLGEQAVKVAPYQLRWYGNLSRTYYSSGVYHLMEGKPAEASKFFRPAVDMASRVQDLIDRIPEKMKRMWISPPDLKMPPEVLMYAGACSYLRGDSQNGEKMLLMAVSHDSTAVEANLWLSVMHREDHDLNNLYLSRALEIDGQIMPLYDNLKSLAEKAESLTKTNGLQGGIITGR